MYKAIIADDEQKICQLISYVGNWDEYGIEIIDSCYDGESAYESILMNKPDIVLTDIRMPVYDGLELIQKIRKQGLNTSFIVISGYKEFDYAKRALQYGAVDFLVKPINKEDLNLSLKRALSEIEEQKRQEQISNLVLDRERDVKRNFFSQLTSDGQSEDYVDETSAQEMEGYFSGNIFQAVIIKTDRPELNYYQSKFAKDLVAYLEDESEFGEMIPLAKGDCVYMLLNYKMENREQIIEGLEHLLKRLFREQELYGKFRVTIALGSITKEIKYMKASINTAREALLYRIFLKNQEIIQYDEIDKYEDKVELWNGEEWVEFQSILERCDQKGISRFFDTISRRAYQISKPNPKMLFSLVDKIVEEVEKHVQMEDEEKSEAASVVLNELHCCGSLPQLFIHLSQYVEKRIGDYYERKITSKKTPIIMAEKYLSENYMKDVSLEEMAEIVGLSTAYFSKLFKQVEGVNFIDYLTSLRMEKAKELLKNTDKAVKAISIEIGYPSEKYFRKLFKKIVGIKPSDFRKLH